MKRTKININLRDFPKDFHYYLKRADVYDSSCSEESRVYFLDVDGGLYLKTAKRSSLKKEAMMDDYFYRRGLGAPEVLAYLSGEKDWLMTTRLEGEDCTDPMYLSEPKRLCELLATKLRELHETDIGHCPIQDSTESYLALAEKNRRRGRCDLSFMDAVNADEAWQVLSEGKHLLKSDALIHGDYCLPNVIMNNWNFSGFVDLGNGGVGDRHVDLFWGAWTLKFNLGTDEYRDLFLDAYGRDVIDEDVLRTVAAAEVFG